MDGGAGPRSCRYQLRGGRDLYTGNRHPNAIEPPRKAKVTPADSSTVTNALVPTQGATAITAAPATAQVTYN